MNYLKIEGIVHHFIRILDHYEIIVSGSPCIVDIRNKDHLDTVAQAIGERKSIVIEGPCRFLGTGICIEQPVKLVLGRSALKGKNGSKTTKHEKLPSIQELKERAKSDVSVP